MRFIALLSGGKDSVYNTMQSLRLEHTLVAVANLGPPQGADELDSYMFQTVGQAAVQSIAEALGVPLYARTISGTPLSTGATYDPTSGDETEDLFRLIEDISAKHEVDAVASGAILSTYQRVRVENVCARLGLVSLAYLWEREQTALLDDMVSANVEAVLVKIAGAGLRPAHLGRTLAQMQPLLLKYNGLFETHPCGEGGEYETLTLNCPLFSHRICLEWTPVVERDDFASVAHMHVTNITQGEDNPPPDLSCLRIPPLLDEESEHVLNLVCSDDQKDSHKDAPSEDQTLHKECAISYVVTEAHCESAEKSLYAALSKAFEQAKAPVVHVNLHVAPQDMMQFAALNKVYAAFFGTNPPSRACVATELPQGSVRVSLVVTDLPTSTLHVQSYSFWAPASIGPYAQAKVVDNQVAYIAGQIPLIPRDLSLLEAPFATQCVLALQHVRRIRERTAPGLPVSSAICWLAIDETPWADKVAVARDVWVHTFPKCTKVVFASTPALPRGAALEWQLFLGNSNMSYGFDFCTNCDGARSDRLVVPCRYIADLFNSLDMACL